MGTINNGVAFGFAYGLPPQEDNENIPRVFVISDVTDANGNYEIDLSECVNENLIGHIQSVVMTVIGAAATTQLTFIHGISGIRFSCAPWAANFDGKAVFPFIAPPSATHHRLVSTVGNTAFQLAFVNVPFAIVNGGNAF